jgi:hypothetical protein
VLAKPEPNVDPLLWAAIEQRRLLRLRYKNKERIVEPHDYGIHNGMVKLLGYQIGGSSSHKLPNWRWMETDLISDIRLLSQSFPGGRPAPSGKHHKWDKLFIRVRPANEDREQALFRPDLKALHGKRNFRR